MDILVDMDGVIADFSTGFYLAAKDHPRLGPHYPDITQEYWEIEDAFPENLRLEVTEIYHQKGFFLNLPPIPNAIEQLKVMQSIGYNLVICTTPLKRYYHCVNEKYEWVERYLGYEWTLNIMPARDKTRVRADFLIDDNPYIKGRYVPDWRQIIFDAPYNRLEGDRRPRMTWDNWREVLQTI